MRPTAAKETTVNMNRLTPSNRTGFAHRPTAKSAPPKATAKPASAPSPGTPPKLGKPPGGIGTRPTAEELLVRHTMEAAAIVLSRVLNRPVDDMLKAIAREVRDEAARGSASFPGVIETAKARIASYVRAGIS